MKPMKITKDDYCLVARTMGWPGGNSTKASMLDWFQSKGIGMDEVLRKVATMRAAVRNGAAPVAAPTAAPVDFSAVERLIDERLRAATASIEIDDATLARHVAAAVAAAQPARIVLNGEKDPAPVKLTKRTHPAFEKVLRLVAAGLNVLLVGPAGCGKTTLAEQVGVALKRRYGTLHCTSGASESQLTGWLLPVGEGKAGTFTYVASEFVRLYEGGDSVFLLDEIDAADPNVLLVINAALANGALHVPQRHENPHVKRGKNVAIIAAANTFGTGADTLYAGRNQLDAATLDRFYVVRMGYDEALEAEIVGQPAPSSPRWEPEKHTDTAGLELLAAWVRSLRDRVATHRLRRVVSTRTFQKAAAAYRVGVSVAEIKADLVAGWSRDELAKAEVTL